MTRSDYTAKGLVLLLVGAVGLAASGYASAYMFYRKTLGEWEVYCSAENEKAQKSCRLAGPPAKMGNKTPQNVLAVAEIAPDSYTITLEVRDLVMPDLPAFLRIDRYRVHEAPVKGGKAEWRDEKALQIVSEMRSGKIIVYRVQTAPDGMPRDTRVSLKQFREALRAYRVALRGHGLLKKGK